MHSKSYSTWFMCVCLLHYSATACNTVANQKHLLLQRDMGKKNEKVIFLKMLRSEIMAVLSLLRLSPEPNFANFSFVFRQQSLLKLLKRLTIG